MPLFNRMAPGSGSRNYGKPIGGTRYAGGFNGNSFKPTAPKPAPVSPMQQFITQYQDAWDRARAANESRYNEIKGGYTNLRNRAMQDLQGIGQQQIADVHEGYNNLNTQQQASLHSQGLAGTTIAPTLKMGVERERQEALNRTNAGLRRERIGYDTDLTSRLNQFMENRTDAYPDLGQFAALMEQFGMAGGGGGRRVLGGSKAGGGRIPSPTSGKRGAAKESRADRIKRQAAEKAERMKAAGGRVAARDAALKGHRDRLYPGGKRAAKGRMLYGAVGSDLIMTPNNRQYKR